MADLTEMTVAQLQAEIGRLQVQLAVKVLGDPRRAASVCVIPPTTCVSPATTCVSPATVARHAR